jgi:hypothetical protein
MNIPDLLGIPTGPDVTYLPLILAGWLIVSTLGLSIVSVFLRGAKWGGDE